MRTGTTKKTRQTSYDSIAAAASAMDVPKSVLQKLKREGAPGFRGSRVYPDELTPYLRAREKLSKEAGVSETKEELECRRLRATCERIEHRLAVDRADYVAKGVLSEHLVRFGAEMKQILRQKESEFRELVQGKNPDEVQSLFANHVTDAILNRLQEHFGQWTI